MELNDLKPNFERIASVHRKLILTQNQSNFWENKFIKNSPYPDNVGLMVLLKDFNLENHYNDFLFLGTNCLQSDKSPEDIERSLGLYANRVNEILYALKFLMDHPKGIRIDIAYKWNITSINDQLLIQVIKKALIEYFVETNYHFEDGIIKPDEIKDWGKFINFLVAKKEHLKPKKGRKRQNIYIGGNIDILQLYLQRFTNIKADEGIQISRKQASFIFKFLRLFNLIDVKLSWEEDNIRHILKKYLKGNSEIKRKSIDEILKGIEDYEVEIKKNIIP